MNRREQLYLPAKELRVQTGADGSKTLGGYALVYNSRSVDLGGFTELIAPGAVTESLKQNPDVLMLRDHKQELLMGRTKAGTLTLIDDPVGLRFSCKLPDTQQAIDLATSVTRGDLDGVSFGFQTIEDSWTSDGEGNVIRTLLKINLFEISPTSFAAYPAANVSVRSCPPELRSLLRSKRDDQDEDECDCEKNPDGTHVDPDCTCDDEDEQDRSTLLNWSERTLLRIEVARRK
ncbi:prohead peptidase. Unknown type peptidase. MEROPS family U35 [Granulicella rosea]|uniref:Prohead serine protease domain-containing protein n=1 Tax=Granulicella rosea TaxID=474952 RepID=A0A239H947_9BACT|nr:HK97 family phage prohead protease [Granulicella rosea]SNS77782.1 prohead peptidase. Unknown type peptidase. MEROPS family U35 [Granulicella rosea]